MAEPDDTPKPIMMNLRGRPIESAPAYLRSYLDCVDGAFAVGGWFTADGRQTHAKWSLSRGGEEVGIVVIAVPDHG